MKYQCRDCGAVSLRWEGRCSTCGQWGTLEEVGDSNDYSDSKSGSSKVAPAKYTNLADFADKKGELELSKSDDFYGIGERLSTGFPEFDRVLGGGLVKGEAVLISGEPGIGKSTMLSQVSMNVSKTHKVLYVSGEESVAQLLSRLNRLQSFLGDTFKGADLKKRLKNIIVTDEINVLSLIELFKDVKPDFIIIDSIQAMVHPEYKNTPGSINQVKVCGSALIRFAKTSGIPTVMVGQINKEGSIAGPKVLEHMVDCVLYFEGDEYNVHRVLRSLKNRFGSTNEIGLFEMSSGGLVEVLNPSEIFLRGGTDSSGCAISAVIKGSRVVFVEVQALTVERGAESGPLRRVANGIKKPRLDMLTAVMTKRGKVFLGNMDVFVNIVGGLSVDDPAIDLAVCAAIKSAVEDKVLDRKALYLGEVGLSGEVRKFVGLEAISKESSKLGYDKIVTGDFPLKTKSLKHVQVSSVRNLQ